MKYSSKSIYILLAIIGLLASCKNEVKKAEDSSPSKINSIDPYISSTQKLLQGTWTNLDEKAVTVIFNGNTRVENVKGKPLGKTRYFEIADECKNDAVKAARVVKAKAKYISMQDIDMCYYIIKLNKSRMELKVVGRGNTLRYKRERTITQPTSDSKIRMSGN